MLKKILFFIVATTVLSTGLLRLDFTGSKAPRLSINVASAATVCNDGKAPRDINGVANICPEDLNSTERSLYGQTVCQGSGLSWLVCPIINMLTEAIESAEKFILQLLYNKPLTVGARNTASGVIYQIWGNIRIIANSLLVVVFLIMILGNAVSIGVDAYTVKRTLPRLIVAAILIQFSFALCALLVEVTNVIALGILEQGDRILYGSTVGGTTSPGLVTTFGAGIGLVTAAGLMLASLLSGAGVVMLLAAVISAIGTLITLGLRQLLIIMLVVASPLAILAWVLPNTESLFKTWSKNLLRTMFMFPLIAALFVIARIGSLIAANSGGTVNDVLSFILIIVPLFAVPFTFKWAGGIMAAGAGAISKISSGRSQALKGSDFAKNLKESRREANLAKSAEPGVGFGAKTKRSLGKLGAYGIGSVAGGGATKGSRMRYQQKVTREGTAAKTAIATRYQESLKAKGNGLEAYDFSGTDDAKARNLALLGKDKVEAIEKRVAEGHTSAHAIYGAELLEVARGGESTLLGASGKDVQMQTAAISEMAGRGDIEELRGLQSPEPGDGRRDAVSQSTIMAGIGDKVGDIAAKAPDIIKRDAPGHAVWGKMTGEKITALDESSVKLMADYMGDTSLSTDEDINAKTQIRNEAIRIATDPNLQKNLTPKAKAALKEILAGSGHSIT